MRKALLVIGMQNAVLDGIDSAEDTISRVAALMAWARESGALVVWVQHDDVTELPRGSQGWQLASGLRPEPGNLLVAKQHRSPFADTGLARDLRTADVGSLILTGAQSAFCVDMAGKHALAEGFDVTLVSDGHCNGSLRVEGDELSDSQVTGLINRTWSSLTHPGREVNVTPANDITS